MSKKPRPLRLPALPSAGSLRVYPAPWKGRLILACRKCQKKLKSTSELTNLKRLLKLRSRTGQLRLRILQVPCLKLCPKDAVAVCTQHQLASAECSILRTSGDLDLLYAQCLTEATPEPRP